MLCIDTLQYAATHEATALAQLRHGHILLHAGVLTRAGHIELAAQTAGTMKGFAEAQLGSPVREGFLAAAQDFSFLSDAKEGDTLRIEVVLTAEVAGVSLLEAAIYREKDGEEPELLSTGKLKVFMPESC